VVNLVSLSYNYINTTKQQQKQQQEQQLFNSPLSRATWVRQYQKGKTNLDVLEQEIVSGSCISWAICKSAPCPRQVTMPALHHSVLQAGCPSCRPINQSTEGNL